MVGFDLPSVHCDDDAIGDVDHTQAIRAYKTHATRTRRIEQRALARFARIACFAKAAAVYDRKGYAFDAAFVHCRDRALRRQRNHHQVARAVNGLQ